MTTAGRPTWKAASGSNAKAPVGNRVSAPIKQYSARDLPSHTKLKVRQLGQNTESEVKKRDLVGELDRKERSKKNRK